MAEASAAPNRALDAAKLAASLLVLAAGIVGFYWFNEEPVYIRVPALLVAVGISLALFFITSNGRVIWGYMQGSRTEVRKMVWPTRQETFQTTLTIFIVVGLLGVFLWLIDMLLLNAVRFITGQGG